MKETHGYAVANPSKFYRFDRLPPEIRSIIWFFCLPRRVVPTDDPLFCSEYDEAGREQQCWPSDGCTYRRPRSPPVIALVCREAREVALRWGVLEQGPTDYLNSSLWVQRKLDTILCSWTPSHSAWKGHDLEMLGEFLDDQIKRHPGSPFCLLAEHIHPFHPVPTHRDNGTGCLQVLRKPHELDNMLYRADDSAQTDSSIVMDFINIHATRAEMRESGLFGLLGDAPSQLVDYDDAVTIARFRAIFDEDPRNSQRKRLVAKFDAVGSPDFKARVETWVEGVRWMLLVRRWLLASQHKADGDIFTNPQQVFDNVDMITDSVLTGGPHGPINQFKRDHPWVIRERERLPKLQPKIWFTCCVQKCRVKGSTL